MESTYTDIVELIDSKIEWHQAEVEKLTSMREQLESGEESEPQEVKPAAKRGRKAAVKSSGTVKAKRNGNASGGERKQQIIALLEKDMAVMDIARQLGTHPNYVRTVKKNYEGEQPKSSKRRVVRTAK